MSQITTIEWATHSWNPTRGCSRVSPGCQNCYAERIAARFSTHPLQDGDNDGGIFAGFAKRTPSGPRWTGKVELIESKLLEPLSWRKPRPRVFVNSMSDLFHEALHDNEIDKVFGVMALCPGSNFLILTKRAERMFLYIDSTIRSSIPGDSHWSARGHLPNVWLGVSVEDRKHKDRIDWLRKTPAAVRFLSLEPLLEDLGELDLAGIDQCIVGGESGPGARGCDLAWIRSIQTQCSSAGIACFIKQLGAKPFDTDFNGHISRKTVVASHAKQSPWLEGFTKVTSKSGVKLIKHLRLNDRKGGDWDEWPADLKVREFPNAI